MFKGKSKYILIVGVIALLVALAVFVQNEKERKDKKEVIETGVVEYVQPVENVDKNLPEVSDNTVNDSTEVATEIDPALVDSSTNLPYVATQDISNEISRHKQDTLTAEAWMTTIEPDATYSVLQPLAEYMRANDSEYVNLDLSFIDAVDFYVGTYIKYAVGYAESLRGAGSIPLVEMSIENLYNNTIKHVVIATKDNIKVYDLYIAMGNGKIVIYQADPATVSGDVNE